MINSEDLPYLVQKKLDGLKPEYQKQYINEYRTKKKSVGTAYLLLIVLGWHYAYLKKWGIQVLCWITFWGFLIWWVIDLFRIPKLVKEYNEELALKIINQYSFLIKENPQTTQKTLTNTSNSNAFRSVSSGLTINELYRKKPNRSC
ncbi:TM2 domain-containing protein [Gramella sp. GC03-9]|uniref:TM2 domain-containing protein n=1 Tax=Christiangramia oceanisediminis TaxID=2920386 RepID=A0A9X2I8F7_9FLAO|nr:TM2 domain-containing protein [Gramella oceanisediminis]MCP9199132.1 TM2 domain-containing protein [Gramella oceanisediminis]